MTTSVQSKTRELARGLIIGGAAGILLAVGRGLSTGRLLQAGSNNLVMAIAGLAFVVLGLILHQPAASGIVTRLLAASNARSQGFPERASARPMFYAWFGLSFGLATGVAESAYRQYHGPAVAWPHSLWLAPIVDSVLFLIVGFGLTIAARLRPGPSIFRLALKSFLTLGFAAMLILMLPMVHPAAAAVLAVGLAVQLTRLLAGHALTVAVVVRRSAWLAGMAVVATAIWAFRVDTMTARPERPMPPDGARNVVLLVLDTVRAKSLSLLGHQRKTTPTIERWSKNGVVFQSAMATAPWTIPSHAGMFTGRWTHELGTADVLKLDGTFPTIAEVMRDHGYHTAGFVANLVNTARATGLARGFDHYEDFKISAGEAILSASLGRTLLTADALRNLVGHHELVNRKVASAINADFLHWLDRRGGGPFFAFLNYLDAHEPYEPPARYAGLFRTGPVVSRGSFIHQVNNAGHADWWKLSARQVANELALYEGAIASLDHEIGSLLEALDQRGVLKNTVVILTSDHGESFGEHGVFGHSNSLYLDQLHVPLWILTPDAVAPRSVRESVSLRDLPTTVIDLARVPVASPFPGASLARFWRTGGLPSQSDQLILLSLFALPGGTAGHRTPLSRGNLRGVIEDPYHYILNGDGVEELYNYRLDPLEASNLAGSPAAKDRLSRFRDAVSRMCPPARTERRQSAGHCRADESRAAYTPLTMSPR